MTEPSVFPNITDPTKRAFLTAFALTGHVAKSCHAAGVVRQIVYSPGWARDESFQEAYMDARLAAGDVLTDEAQRRALGGNRNYKFDKEGIPLKHPDECDCGHPRSLHVTPSGDSLPRACTGDECECASFHGRPYYESVVSDTLLIFLLKGTFPDRHREIREVRGLLANLDLNMLPNALIQRIAQGEAIESVLAAGASEAGITPGELVRGALKPGDPPAT